MLLCRKQVRDGSVGVNVKLLSGTGQVVNKDDDRVTLGLVQKLLLRLLSADFFKKEFNICEQLALCFEDPLSFDRNFPGTQRHEFYGATEPDLQWLEALTKALKLWKDTMIILFDGELDKYMVIAWQQTRSFDIVSLWNAQETLKEKYIALKHACGVETRAGGGVGGDGGGGGGGNGGGNVTDEDTFEDDDGSKQVIKDTAKTISAEASATRNKTIALLEVSLNMVPGSWRALCKSMRFLQRSRVRGGICKGSCCLRSIISPTRSKHGRSRRRAGVPSISSRSA